MRPNIGSYAHPSFFPHLSLLLVLSCMHGFVSVRRLFKECPHPDEKQRGELSKRLGLDPRQVKFWFQNRRTQMKVCYDFASNSFLFFSSEKSCHFWALHSVDMVYVFSPFCQTQLERHENFLLKEENDKLRAENITVREAVQGPTCGCCGSLAMLGEVSLEEQHLRIENARLKDELTRIYALATKFLGKDFDFLLGNLQQPQLSLPMPSSSLELAVGGLGGMGSMPPATMPGTMGDFAAGGVSNPPGTVITPARAARAAAPPTVSIVDRSMLVELAISAMDQLVKMAQVDEPLWLKSMPDAPNMETLNFEEYARSFVPCLGMKPVGFVSEVSRESGLVIIDNSAELVETLMDQVRARVS
jgi:homeobox-leucine zipper protein